MLTLAGTLPTWSGGFKKAQLFGLSSNNFNGSLPSSWKFPALSTLEVGQLSTPSYPEPA